MQKRNLIFSILVLISSFVFAEPNLSGTWKFNAAESDNPRSKFDGMHQGGQTQPGQGQGYGRWHGSSQGGYSQGESHKDHGGHGPFEPPQSLTITYAAPELKITDDKGKERILYTDGRKSEREIDSPRRGKVTITSTASWSDDQLVEESQMPDGGNMTVTYELAPDGKQLFIKSKMKTIYRDEPIEIRRVYDRVTEGQAQP
jgi:hypothetical protein